MTLLLITTAILLSSWISSFTILAPYFQCSQVFPFQYRGYILNAPEFLSMFVVMPVTLLTYLLTPWSRVLLEKLASLQLVKKFPAFYGTWRFLAAVTSARHLSLSWASPIQSSYPNPTSWRSILILSSHLRLGLPCGLSRKYADRFFHSSCLSTCRIFAHDVHSPLTYYLHSSNRMSDLPALPASL